MLSSRKTAKEGPVSDMVACSHTAVIFGSRIRVKEETQQENVQALLETLPTVTAANHQIKAKFDGGCGKMSFLQVAFKKITTVSPLPTQLVPECPSSCKMRLMGTQKWNLDNSLLEAEVTERVSLFDAWTLKGLPSGGPTVRVAKRNIAVEEGNGKEVEVCAVTVQDIFDEKAEVKDLRFFPLVMDNKRNWLMSGLLNKRGT